MYVFPSMLWRIFVIYFGQECSIYLELGYVLTVYTDINCIAQRHLH